MADKILFFDTSETKDYTFKILNDEGYDVFSVSSIEEVSSNLKDGDFKLLISEINMEQGILKDYFSAVTDLLNTKEIPHMAVTDSKNLFDITMAEAANVRPILLKPVYPEHLKNAVHFSILNLRHGLVLCGEKDKTRLQRSFESMGFDVKIILAKFEFSRQLYENKVDFIVYVDGFKGLMQNELLESMQSFKKKIVPLCFFLHRSNMMFEYALQKYGPYKIILPPHDFDNVEDVLKTLIIEAINFSKEQGEKETVKVEKKVVEKEKKAEVTSFTDESLSETNSGDLSVLGFIKTVDKIFSKKNSIAFSYFFKKGSNYHKTKCIDIFDELGDVKIFHHFFKAYNKGNNSLRISISELFSDINLHPDIMNFLIKVLRDPLEEVRYSALLGLKSYPVKQTSLHVKVCLVDSSLKIRQLAAGMLKGVKDFSLIGNFLKSLLVFEDINILNALIKFLDVNYKSIKDLTVFNEIFMSDNSLSIDSLIDFFLEKKDQRISPILKYLAKLNNNLISRSAVLGLQQLNDLSVIDDLLSLLNSSNGEVAHKAIIELIEKNRSSKYIDTFISIVKKGDDRLRESILEIVKDFKEKDKIDILKHCFMLGDTPTKLTVIDSLTNVDIKKVILLIAPYLDSDDILLTDYIYTYLEKRADTSCLESLVKVFDFVKKEESKDIIAKMLGVILEKEDGNPLLKLAHLDAYSNFIKFLQTSDVSLGKYTADILGEKIEEDSSFELVLKSLYDKNIEARAEAASVLGDSKNNSAVSHLKKFIDDDNWYVRRMVIEALGKLGAKESSSQIERYLSDENAAVRYASSITLNKFGVKVKDYLFGLIVFEDTRKVLDNLVFLITPFPNHNEVADYLSKLNALDKDIRIKAAASLLSMRDEFDTSLISSWFGSGKIEHKLLSMMVIAKRNPEMILNKIDNFLQDESDQIRGFLIEFLSTSKKRDEMLFEKVAKYYKTSSANVRNLMLKKLHSSSDLNSLNFVLQEFLGEDSMDVVATMLDIFEDSDDSRIPDVLRKKEDYAPHLEKRAVELRKTYLS